MVLSQMYSSQTFVRGQFCQFRFKRKLIVISSRDNTVKLMVLGFFSVISKFVNFRITD